MSFNLPVTMSLMSLILVCYLLLSGSYTVVGPTLFGVDLVAFLAAGSVASFLYVSVPQMLDTAFKVPTLLRLVMAPITLLNGGLGLGLLFKLIVVELKTLDSIKVGRFQIQRNWTLEERLDCLEHLVRAQGVKVDRGFLLEAARSASSMEQTRELADQIVLNAYSKWSSPAAFLGSVVSFVSAHPWAATAAFVACSGLVYWFFDWSSIHLRIWETAKAHNSVAQTQNLIAKSVDESLARLQKVALENTNCLEQHAVEFNRQGLALKGAIEIARGGLELAKANKEAMAKVIGEVSALNEFMQLTNLVVRNYDGDLTKFRQELSVIKEQLAQFSAKIAAFTRAPK